MQCRLYVHLAFTCILRWSLKRSVKQRTWTGSPFSTNESVWSVMVRGSQSRVWSGPDTKLGDHGTPNSHNRWCSLFYHVRTSMNKSSLNNIRLSTPTHMTSHDTWGSVTTPHDLGGALGQPLHTFSFGLSPFHSHGSWLLCEAVIREIFGHNWWRSECLQFQSVTCWHPPVSLY